MVVWLKIPWVTWEVGFLVGIFWFIFGLSLWFVDVDLKLWFLLLGFSTFSFMHPLCLWFKPDWKLFSLGKGGRGIFGDDKIFGKGIFPDRHIIYFILRDSRNTIYYIFGYNIVSKIGWIRSPKRRVRNNNFCSARIILGFCRHLFYIDGSNFRDFRSSLEFRISWQAQYFLNLKDIFNIPFLVNDLSYIRCINHNTDFPDRINIGGNWRMIFVVLRILNNLLYIRYINHKIDFAWQQQYLVKLVDDSCYFVHWNRFFICEAD